MFCFLVKMMYYISMNEFDVNKKNGNKNVNCEKKSVFKRVVFILLFIVLLPFILIYWIVSLIIKIVRKRRWEKNGVRGKMLLLSSDIHDIDIMEGYEFEEYLKTLFFYDGYQTEITTKSRDFGADLIISKDGERCIVQAKRYSKTVGVKSVQEIIGALKHYNAESVMVVTNSYFTDSAEILAKENDVRLVDRNELIEIYTRVKQNLNLSTKESELINKEDRMIEEKFPFII